MVSIVQYTGLVLILAALPCYFLRGRPVWPHLLSMAGNLAIGAAYFWRDEYVWAAVFGGFLVLGLWTYGRALGEGQA